MSDDGGNGGRSGDGNDDGSADDERDRPASRVSSLSVDATLELLADYERRRVLGYLMDADDDTATVDELVDHLVACRTEGTDDPPDRDPLATRIYHVHLPKLAEAGVVEFDDRSKEVRYWGEDRLEACHAFVRSQEEL